DLKKLKFLSYTIKVRHTIFASSEPGEESSRNNRYGGSNLMEILPVQRNITVRYCRK
ncbi:unnamed protein product, partial [Brassica oleracea var. botrytis]